MSFFFSSVSLVSALFSTSSLSMTHLIRTPTNRNPFICNYYYYLFSVFIILTKCIFKIIKYSSSRLVWMIYCCGFHSNCWPCPPSSFCVEYVSDFGSFWLAIEKFCSDAVSTTISLFRVQCAIVSTFKIPCETFEFDHRYCLLFGCLWSLFLAL